MAKKRARKALKVAIIGAGGRAASTHYPCLAEMADCELVAACDLDEDRVASVCDTFDIKGRYTKYEQMIESERPDLVYAVMPPHHLYDVTATIIDMGCHVVIEKPPAVTSEQVRQLAILARRKKVLTGVTFQRRFSPLLRQGKSWCEERGGQVHTAHASFYKNWAGGAPYYRGATDMLTTDGIHAVDTLRWLCDGEVESVAGDSRRLDAEHWNMHLALVRFSSGATGVLLVNFMAGRRIFSVEIHAPGVTFFGDPEEGGKLYADSQLDPVETLDPFAMADSDQPHRAFGPWEMTAHFLDAVRRKRPMETCFDDALKTMELVDAVYGEQI
ncbi:MAG: Gfo/Idh/MocA family oxidoreductase [Gemmatimonadetes bacterium]|jgi:virulence factor|nr:Gfo/Idh/MocA family oxidoreductase [Gemmatimonadota bacterium]MBT6147653.1 Gfo/Idh/MocA family oxidoreductase [Gemmatimonadota bacterium]MBT7860037.1 Gfo/Idh/MocA family oxidoreductase [Gemmatimonadota bacterium]